MRRREFIAGLGAAAWVSPARAQQSAVPVVGFVYAGSADTSAGYLTPWNVTSCHRPRLECEDNRMACEKRSASAAF